MRKLLKLQDTSPPELSNLPKRILSDEEIDNLPLDPETGSCWTGESFSISFQTGVGWKDSGNASARRYFINSFQKAVDAGEFTFDIPANLVQNDDSIAACFEQHVTYIKGRVREIMKGSDHIDTIRKNSAKVSRRHSVSIDFNW